MMAIKVEQPKVLVVEGKEEELFFGTVMRHMGLEIQIIAIGGKEKLRQNLKALAQSPGFSRVVSLGIVRDADEDPHAAFQSISDALRSAGLHVPKRPLEPLGHRPQIVVMILPDEHTPGMLEDLCLRSVEQDPALACVDQYFHCLQQKGVSLPRNFSKGKVQVFLGSREKAGLRLGEAAQAGVWPWDSPAFENVKNFLGLLCTKSLQSRKDASSDAPM